MRDSVLLDLAGAGADGERTVRRIRNRMIRDAHSGGWSYREIGRATKIPYKTVERIVKAKDQDRGQDDGDDDDEG